MNNHIDVAGLIFQLIALGIPVIFIIILSFFWSSSKKRNEHFNPTDQKLDMMEKKIKKWMNNRN